MDIQSIKTLAEARVVLEKLQSEQSAKDTQIAKTQEELKDSQDKFQKLESTSKLQTEEVASLTHTKVTLEAEVTRLTAANKDADRRAAEICASMGVTPVTVSPKGEPSVKGDLLAEFKSIQDPAKQMAFYRKNREQLNAVSARTFAQ